MNKKSKAIIGLLAIGIVLFCAIQFWFLPANRTKQAEYIRNQTDALTHDISVVEDYKTSYIGDANNVRGLFEVLPLNNISMNIEINSEDCVLTVNYLDTVWNIGEEKVRRDLVYNSVAAMAAVDNLSGITYNFSGDRYSFTREQMESTFAAPLSNLLEQEEWSERVQNRLSDTNFIGHFFK